MFKLFNVRKSSESITTRMDQISRELELLNADLMRKNEEVRKKAEGRKWL